VEEVQIQEAVLAGARAPAAEAVMSVRGAREDVEQILSLLSDEETVVRGLLDAIMSPELPVNRIPIEPSALPPELGEVDDAHVASNGNLVVGYPDGDVASLDLSLQENRGALVRIVDDLVPKLRGLVDGSYVLEEPPVEEPIFEEAKPEPEEVEPEEEAPPEPEAEEELGEPLVEEPQLDEEPALEDDEPEVEPEPPLEYETAFEEAIEAETAIPEPLEPETPEHRMPEAEPVVEAHKPQDPKDVQVKKIRRRVKVQRTAARREMERVRRQREAQIRRLRTQSNGLPLYGEEKGLMGQVKGLFSKIRRKKR